MITLKNLNKIYDDHNYAVKDFNLEIEDQEFVVLVGPSGCGKSTTLRMIAGLEEVSQGEIYVDGVRLNQVPPKDRGIAMVFQNYALYPHMTVYNNLAFGLKMRGVKKKHYDQRIREAANILEITHLLDRKPKALSGGQRQRVALGRAIVRDAKIFLMDEPLSNLDAKLRTHMRTEIVKLHKEMGATTLYVTHDQIEAMTMATKIVLLKEGVIQQVGTPEAIYHYPKNQFVATFIGHPAMNIIPVVQNEQGWYFHQHLIASVHIFNGMTQQHFNLGVRSEYIHFASDIKDLKENEIQMPDWRVVLVELIGATKRIHCKQGETEIVISADNQTDVEIGQCIHLGMQRKNCHCFHSETGEVLLQKQNTASEEIVI